MYTRGLNARSVPFQIALGPDGNLWFTDEGRRPAIGRVTPSGAITEFSRGLRRDSPPFAITAIGRIATGAPPALRAVPAPAGVARTGRTLTCPPTSFAAWDRLAPAAPAFGFDGDRWLRDGVATGVRGAQYRVRPRDAGHRLACRVTATYPAPFLTTAVGRSPAVTAHR